jgi:hypothetical protein
MKKQLLPSQLHAGPIRHPVLPEGFIDRIVVFKQTLGDVDPMQLEKTIDAFKRDAHPEAEIVIWERIASTFQLFLSHNPTADPAVRKDIFAVLVGASMGTQDWDNIKHLSKVQIEHLVLNYRGLAALSKRPPPAPGSRERSRKMRLRHSASIPDAR